MGLDRRRTPVAYKRWKQLKAQDEARESAGR